MVKYWPVRRASHYNDEHSQRGFRMAALTNSSNVLLSHFAAPFCSSATDPSSFYSCVSESLLRNVDNRCTRNCVDKDINYPITTRYTCAPPPLNVISLLTAAAA
jgi:hypothetical protein